MSAALALAACLWARGAAADPPAASASAAAPPPDPAADEDRPTGREVAPARARPAPSEAPDVACSFEQPICVHAATSVDPAATLWTLRHAERAMRVYQALGLPTPLGDVSLGGSPAFDIYLLPGAGSAVTTADLVAASGGPDRASAFTVMPPPTARSGCAAPAAVAQAIAHAICLHLDAGAEDGAIAMASSFLASLAVTCPLTEIPAIDDFQGHPERSFMTGDPDRPTGAMLFPWYLDEAYGRGVPGHVITALLGIATQITPPGAWEYRNEPDIFDALRVTMKQRGSSVDAMLLDFAVSRAFVGSRSDGAHLTDAARFGAAGRVRFEWSVPWTSLPRRLAPAAPLDPTGMTYLWLDLAGAPPDAELTFVADWELPSLFRWALVKIDKDGAEAGRIDVAGVFGSNHAERTVAKLDGLAGIVVVGVNTGSVDRGHPYDPDEQPLMPHSYTVMLAK